MGDLLRPLSASDPLPTLLSPCHNPVCAAPWRPFPSPLVPLFLGTPPLRTVWRRRHRLLYPCAFRVLRRSSSMSEVSLRRSSAKAHCTHPPRVSPRRHSHLHSNPLRVKA